MGIRAAAEKNEGRKCCAMAVEAFRASATAAVATAAAAMLLGKAARMRAVLSGLAWWVSKHIAGCA